MEVGKTLREIELLTVDGDRSIRRVAGGGGRQIVEVGGEEPAHPCTGAFEIAGLSARLTQVHLAGFDLAEQPEQQIEEVDADVGGNPSGPLDRSLPRDAVPRATPGDVGEVDVVLAGIATVTVFPFVAVKLVLLTVAVFLRQLVLLYL